MLHPEHSSESDYSCNRRFFLTTLGSAVVGTGLTVGTGILFPAEKIVTLPAVRKEINGTRRNIVATIEQGEENAGTVEYLCMDEGLTFGIVETEGFREFDMTHIVEKATEEGKADTITSRSEILKNMGTETSIQIKKEGGDFLFCGSKGIMAITRANIVRAFKTLQESKKFTQPLIVGDIDCRLQKEIFSRRITVKTIGGIQLHFTEKQPSTGGDIAMK